MNTLEDNSKPAAVAEEGVASVRLLSKGRRSCWREHSLISATLLAISVTALALGLDWLLLGRQRWGPLDMASLANVILGLAVFLLFYSLLRHTSSQQARIAERLHAIDEMNHHIRSALQVISFNARATAGNEWELAEIRRSIERIHWALKEVLPRVEPEFQPFESSGTESPESRDRRH